MAISRSCCIFLIIFVLVMVGVSLSILFTLDYLGAKPRFYIQELYIPALNNSHISNATNLNNSIFIDLKFKRLVTYGTLYYDDLNITMFYASNRTFSVGYDVVPGFQQGNKKTVHRKVVVEARALPWEDEISGGSTVALAVELATKFKVQHCGRYGSCGFTKPKAVVVAADVRLDASGQKLSKKPLRLH